MPPKKKSSKKKVRTKKPIIEGLPTSATMVGAQVEDLIMVFFGPPGVGKTTFVNSLGAVFFMSTDRGTKFIKSMSRPCHNWKQFEKYLVLLEKQYRKTGDCGYDIICIDHVGEWASMAEHEVTAELGVDALADAAYGKGWSMYKKIMEKYIQRLKALNTGIVFIAHDVSKKVKVKGLEVDKVQPDMSKSAYNLIIPLSDIVGYVSMRPVKIKGKRSELRVLETEPSRDLFAKDRTNRDKPENYESLDGKKFIETLA